jgi:transposase
MEKGKRKKYRKGGGRPNKTSESQKKQIALVVLKEKLTLDIAAIRFGVSRQTVNRWVNQYYDDIEQTNVIAKMEDIDAMPTVPSEQIREYEDKLRQAQLKISALETMIELAEDTYKIAIRKNSGTKQQA